MARRIPRKLARRLRQQAMNEMETKMGKRDRRAPVGALSANHDAPPELGEIRERALKLRKGAGQTSGDGC